MNTHYPSGWPVPPPPSPPNPPTTRAGKIIMGAAAGGLLIVTSAVIGSLLTGNATSAAPASSPSASVAIATPAATAPPTPTAAPCPGGFHLGDPADTYSGCYANPTPTPAPIAGDASCQVVLNMTDGTVFYAWAIGGGEDVGSQWFCHQLYGDMTDGSHSDVRNGRIEQGHGTNGRHAQCTGTFGPLGMRVVIGYDGQLFSEANGGAVGACATLN